LQISFLLFFFPIFIGTGDKKSKQKNQGKPDASGRFAGQRHRASILFLKSAHSSFHFLKAFVISINSIIISVSSHIYAISK